MPLALLGTGVSRGIGIGRARIVRHGDLDIPQYRIAPHWVEEEISRLTAALETARAQLRAIREQIPAAIASDIVGFIDAHLLMLEDQALTGAPAEIIRQQRFNAEWALKLQQETLLRVFDEIDDPYLRTRRDDVEHVVRRVQFLLLKGPGSHDRLGPTEEPDRVILADDLSPGELVTLHRHGVAAIVSERGGTASHVAILARSLGIPALVAVHRADQFIRDGEMVVVDGHVGVLLTGLTEADLASYRQRQTQERRRRADLRQLKDVPGRTRDGVPVELAINIELDADIAAARQVGAAGVGLYRTEFLYMNREQPPDEEEQFEQYLAVVRALSGAPVTIRTLDAGADKQVGGEIAPSCPSALGLRAVRYSLKEPELFKTQLRAILRASAHGPIRLLIPMLTTLEELAQVRQMLAAAMGELAQRGHPFDPTLPLGGMIEVPAAALCARQFAQRLDFLSIGTNDLTQYTLAADRMDQAVGHLFDPFHPAVMRLIQLTAAAGEATGTPVAVCGEVAGDPFFTRTLLGFGVSRLSMPPAALLEVKRVVLESDTSRLRPRVAQLVECSDSAAVMGLMEEINALN